MEFSKLTAAQRFLNQRYDTSDYPEDGLDKIYVNNCPTCSKEYLGYKARYACKKCALIYKAKLSAMTSEERQSHDAENIRKALEFLAKIKK